MSAEPIDHAALVTLRFTQDADGELWQCGMKTTARASTDWSAFIDDMKTAFDANLIGLVNKSHLVGIVYSEWASGGFTGFHQRLAKTYNEALGSNAVLPPQCAVVVSLLDDVTLHPIRSRRGRIYHGGVAVGAITSDGRLTSTNQTAIRDAWKAMGTAMQASHSTGLTNPGLCVVSQTQGTVVQATRIGVGIGIDTQRRRRAHVVEGISYVSA